MKQRESTSRPPSEAELQKLDGDIKALKARIESAKKRKQDAQERRIAIASEQYNARQIRDAVSNRINSLEHEKVCLKEQLDAMVDESTRTALKLQRMMQINAINDAFYVWYSGPYGTINNFRLGNLPIKPVEWNEINAALGQALLAVIIVAEKADYQFKKYTLSPLGSFSKVFKIDDKKTPLTLYNEESGVFQLFPRRSFNAALTGFLSCVNELGEFTKTKDPTLQLPYAINVQEGKIYDQVITLGSDEDMWTRALKYLLTDIKWIIAWASKHCNGSLPVPDASPTPKLSKKGSGRTNGNDGTSTRQMSSPPQQRAEAASASPSSSQRLQPAVHRDGDRRIHSPVGPGDSDRSDRRVASPGGAGSEAGSGPPRRPK